MSYILGIDGGGTSTKFEAFDHQTGQSLFRFTKGAGNVTTNLEGALLNIREGYVEALNTNANCTKIVLGLAGWKSCDQPFVHEKLQRIFEEASFQVYSDIEIAHAAAFKGGDGILALAGTGSVLFGKNKEQSLILGGWGYLLGDELGAYWIAKQSIQQLFHQYEQNKIDEEFANSLLDAMGCHQIQECITVFYKQSVTDVAQLAKVILKLVKENNATAIQVIKTGVELFVEKIELLIQRLHFSQPLAISFAGSTFTKNDRIQQYMKECLKQYSIVWENQEEAAVKGCFYLGLTEEDHVH